MTLEPRPELRPAGAETDFAALNLSVPLLGALATLGLARALPVQSAALRLRDSGRDLLLRAPRQAGKTTALVIAALDHLLLAKGPGLPPAQPCARVLFISPSRTHARAAGMLARSLGQRCGVQTATVHSGGSLLPQRTSLVGASLVVGTPDRLLVHLRSGALQLDALELLVLDEADEVLSLSLAADFTPLMAQVPGHRQTVMGAAVLAPGLLPHALRHLRDPAIVDFDAH